MYKIILKYYLTPAKDVQTTVLTYFDIGYCHKQLKILKDRYINIGATILELSIYKVELIADPEQV